MVCVFIIPNIHIFQLKQLQNKLQLIIFLNCKTINIINKAFEYQKATLNSTDEKLASSFIETAPADITDPFDYIMIRIIQFRLKDFEVSDLETRGSKRNFKIHGYWRTCPFFFVSVSSNSISADN